MVEVRDGFPTRVFRLDGRPVVFIFGSHAWGLNATDDEESVQMTTALYVGKARQFNRRFAQLCSHYLQRPRWYGISFPSTTPDRPGFPVEQHGSGCPTPPC